MRRAARRKRLRYMALPVFDDPEEDIARFFRESSRYIGRARRKGGVLVHCFAGQSRSVALVLAYLIQARLQLKCFKVLHSHSGCSFLVGLDVQGILLPLENRRVVSVAVYQFNTMCLPAGVVQL